MPPPAPPAGGGDRLPPGKGRATPAPAPRAPAGRRAQPARSLPVTTAGGPGRRGDRVELGTRAALDAGARAFGAQGSVSRGWAAPLRRYFRPRCPQSRRNRADTEQTAAASPGPRTGREGRADDALRWRPRR